MATSDSTSATPAGPSTNGNKGVTRSSTLINQPETVDAQTPESKKDKGKSARKMLFKEGYLKPEEVRPAASELHKLFKVIFDRLSLKMPMEVRKALVSFATVMKEAIEDEPPAARNTAESIISRLEEAVEKKLGESFEKMSNRFELSLTDRKVLQSSAKKLDETEGSLQTLAQDIGKSLSEVKETSSNLSNTAKSYKDALVMEPRARKEEGGLRGALPSADPRLTRDMERRSRQVLIESVSDFWKKNSIAEIKDKLDKALAQPTNPPMESPKDYDDCEINTRD